MRTATQGAQARADEGSRLTAAGQGVTDVIVCEELGISARQLRRWRDECRLLGDDAFPGHGRNRDEELTTLKRELASGRT